MYGSTRGEKYAHTLYDVQRTDAHNFGWMAANLSQKAHTPYKDTETKITSKF